MRILKRYIPLCWIGDRLVVYRKGCISLYDTDSGECEFVVTIPMSVFNRLFSLFRLTTRLKRIENISAIATNDSNTVILAQNGIIREIDIRQRSISVGYKMLRGRVPLKFCDVAGKVYFGEYLSNPGRDKVSIYRRVGKDKWEIAYTFAPGETEHIHALVYDGNCAWILTGDFDHCAAIWCTYDNFASVERVCGGSQIYRSCMAFPTSDGLLYATDTPMERNTLRLLKKESDQYCSIELCEINGPVIYGTEVNNKYYFSTSVEGDVFNTCKIKIYLNNHRGKGIVENKSVLYCCDKNYKINEVMTIRKDIFPFVLFQFGVIKFPTGNGKKLVCYPVATTKNDMNTIILS